MDKLRKRFLLPITLCMATALLLTRGQPTQDGNRDRCIEHRCTDIITAYRSHNPSESIQYLKLNQTDTSTTNSKCQCQCEFRFYQAEGCTINEERIEEEHVLNFGYCEMNFTISDQGKYVCWSECQHPPHNPNYPNTTKPVVVAIHGVDTYFVSVYLKTWIWTPLNEGRIERCVQAICLGLQPNTCHSDLQYQLHETSYAESYIYLEEAQNITKQQLANIHRMCQSGYFSKIAPCTTKMFQSVSFCEFNSTFHKLVGNLTFPKTDIGMNASSNEVFPETQEPLATMLCKGDFIRPSYWDVLVVNNCTKYHNTMITEKNIKDNTPLTVPLMPDKSPTLSSAEDINKVTKTKAPTRAKPDPTSKATTMPREDINDDIRVTEENVNEVSLMLSKRTNNPEDFDEVQLMWVSEILQNISKIGSSSREVTSNVLEIVNNLLHVKEHVYKEGISEGVPSRILRALETQLTNFHDAETNFTQVKSLLGVAAHQLERSAFLDNITFGGSLAREIGDATYNVNQSEVSVMAGSDEIFTKFLATITFPANLLDDISTGHNDKIPVTFIIHRTNLLFMSSSSQERRHSERVESLVIAAKVEGHTVTNLSSPVISRFHLPHVDKTMTKNSRKCVFWNITLANGLGDWSSEGCELVKSSVENTNSIMECHCNHLTNFAVLLDVQGDIDHIALDILSIVGCVLSILALVITLIVLLGVKKLREQVPQKIVINLCFALLGLYICFLVGIDQSDLGTGCVIFGALIHYFCLASVAWMCVVATNMYLLFVRVFNVDMYGFMWKACLVAWGLPMILVVLSVILKYQNYNRTGSYCFPQTGTLLFYLGVLLPIGLMLCYNFVIFMLIIRQVTCGRIGRPARQDKRTEMFERAQSIIIISVLLGLTWVFGFLSIRGARFIFNLLFLTFNSLQGLFIFIFFILRPQNVRMILFKSCYRGQNDNMGSYTVNKSKKDGGNQKNTLELEDVFATRSDSPSNF
ncbi:Adhesion G-protein coupled receptor G6 [Holothuria leucospilota]|uniref:Adhesion G-protein coupled receptor G6 n=1 Tax=Holothuria leucospilota TaxID=206669 RepID=A0A9Q1BJC8_HOLLE|nr:Adhesion G-protein coupled receptor G6 [Holothuria leucospilota]